MNHRHQPRLRMAEWAVAAMFLACFLTPPALLAEDSSLTNLLAQGAQHEKEGRTKAALQCYLQADRLAPTNSLILCCLTKQYCDLMHETKSEDEQKGLLAKALNCALNAVKADTNNARAHLCTAVCYTKEFPFSDNKAKVKYSKLIKSEAETAIALDPKEDISYYMLGRWHFEVANMNFLVKGIVKIAYGGLPKASNEDAIQNFKKAIQLAPNRIINHAELAKVYRETGDKKQALAELKKCDELTPLDRDDAEAQTEARKELQRVGAK